MLEYWYLFFHFQRLWLLLQYEEIDYVTQLALSVNNWKFHAVILYKSSVRKRMQTMKSDETNSIFYANFQNTIFFKEEGEKDRRITKNIEKMLV